MSRRTALVSIGALCAGLVAAPALALTDRWAAWTPVQGTANNYRTTMTQRSPGFPEATVVSDSRSPVSIPAGTSAVLGPGTPPGAKYGTSSGSPYLLLRPKADTVTTPSTTTYTFAAPTPDTGWAFVLGDVDADAVRVTATDAGGAAVSAAEVDSWYRGPFNYAGGTDLPSWSATTSTLTGNPAANDTDGASGWFEPDIRLTSLTLTFTRRAGFPVYQTWFVSRARPIGGTVDDVSLTGSCAPTQATMTLVSPFGDVLATTTPLADGSYSFGEYATQAGYVVRLDVPDTCAIVGPAERAVSNRGNDGDPASRADFDVRQIVPQPISGVVTDADGPVAGVVVTLTAPGGGTTTTTTAADGSYLFDDNATGAGYSLSIAVPAGWSAGPGGTTIPGITVATSPIVGQDFTIVALPSVSGAVSGGGVGIGGVQVVLTPAGGGTPITVATEGDGTYVLDAVPPGDYVLSVVAPSGYTAPPPRPVTVPSGGLTGQDVDLSRPGAVGGTVTQGGAPVAGVEVVVDGPSGQVVVATDADGQYFLDQLVAGSWTVTVRPPAGTVVSAASHTVTITAEGEIRGGQDFVLAAAPTTPPTTPPTPTPTPTPTSTPTSSPTSTPTSSPTASPTDDGNGPGGGSDGGSGGGGGGSGVLPDTGGPSVWLGAGSLSLLLSGLGLLALSRRRTRRT
ncbi:carboxypeptidase regulatory-like domain-containing protein [Nocardioides oleivorans]|uniref:Carboxypeptidase regulatory-like domain-containing protein n=1 Tax=Nocardioides oleivorans TaxID=273676 RepID=A0A4Q2RS00_9ACTN|nr:carboxypeptidase-like regulatory domain-containing protein [Nocardioides oleivorans]RYB91717.1 carboxypeptidase regulatory-like domain-containing protein [Nocardioides oleivorans]